jgi:hypothetical protein
MMSMEEELPNCTGMQASRTRILEFGHNSMKVNLLLIVLFVLARCESRKSSDEFDWNSVESQVTNEAKRALLRTAEGFEWITNDTGNDAVYESFHVLDLNSDGKEDMVFNGFLGAADAFVMVFIKVNGSLRRELYVDGYVENISRDGMSSQFIIYKPEMLGEESSDTTSFYETKGNQIVNTRNQQGQIQ